MITRHRLVSCAAVLLAACHAGPGPATTPAASGGLKVAFRDAFMVGTAIAPPQFGERDTASVALIRREFSAITPENVLKWERVHPQAATSRRL